MKNQNIAIDGPSGAGKSTVAKLLAERLGIVYIDTGSMFRAIAYFFLQKGIGAGEAEKIEAGCKEISISIRYHEGEQQVFLNEENVTPFLRSEAVGKLAAELAVYPFIRTKLLHLQRTLAVQTAVVMDGRDIGTCVLPDAGLKIFLTASVETRAERRFLELQAKGVACTRAEIATEIEKRDYLDSHREIAPLRQAEDAVLLDCSHMTAQEAADAIEVLYLERRAAVDGNRRKP